MDDERYVSQDEGLPQSFWKGCKGKIPYRFRRDAVKALQDLMSSPKYRADEIPLQPYRCLHCKQWHLGHSIKPVNPNTGRS
jgi:hypothetical protein